jgi:predicted ABC-class ATPase
MSDLESLKSELRRLDGRPYPAYKDIRGDWDLGALRLRIDHVQGDPFAAPSRLRAWIQVGLGRSICGDPIQRMAAEDWLLRRFGSELSGVRRGSGRSGMLGIYHPGPEIVERSALRLHLDGTAELRFTAGLPARGRRILGYQAEGLLLEDIPRAVGRLGGQAHSPSLMEQIRSVVDQQALRSQLRERGLVAFIGNGSILPRASGVSQAPLEDAVVFEAPGSMEVELSTPSGAVHGMGIGAGICLIVGGGFHGKSTLLQAIQRGHLDHIPGDGRCRVVADPDTVKIRAEDGRRVEGVDISAFLGTLPGGRSTRPFHSDDASGSTSQAAALVEAIESGARLILLDEDTSATNLLVRDERMRRLVPDSCEPITPLVQRIRQLHRELGLSTILVIGGVGDYLAVADQVVLMDHWRPRDASVKARELAGPSVEAGGSLDRPLRTLCRGSLQPAGKGRVRARDDRRLEYGLEEIDLSGMEQVLDGPHAASIGQAIRTLFESMPGEASEMGDLLAGIEAILRDEGLDALSPHREPVGTLIRPRGHEVAGAINRLRSLRCSTRN